jgi:hypothetical protein
LDHRRKNEVTSSDDDVVKVADVVEEIRETEEDVEVSFSALQTWLANEHNVASEKLQEKRKEMDLGLSLHFFPSPPASPTLVEPGHLDSSRRSSDELEESVAIVPEDDDKTMNQEEITVHKRASGISMTVQYLSLCLLIVLMLWFPGFIVYSIWRASM